MGEFDENAAVSIIVVKSGCLFRRVLAVLILLFESGWLSLIESGWLVLAALLFAIKWVSGLVGLVYEVGVWFRCLIFLLLADWVSLCCLLIFKFNLCCCYEIFYW